MASHSLAASQAYPTLPLQSRQSKVDPASLPTLSDLEPIPIHDPDTLKRISAPVKRIYYEEDVPFWTASKAHHQYFLFLARVAQACIGKETVCPPSRDLESISANAVAVIKILSEIDSWLLDIKPLDSPQRFGNLAFRTWGERIEQRLTQLHEKLLPREFHPFIPELSIYLLGSFGSFVRIDYGSGHELSFAAWLCFLRRLGFLGAGDEEAIGLRIIPQYLEVVWNLQDSYKLEPAGSHGVWGLDDYQFIPYILGAAQLASQNDYQPWQISSSNHKPAGGVQQQHVPPEQLLSFVPAANPSGSSRSRAPPLRSIDPSLPLSSNSASRTHAESPPPFANLFTSSIARIHSLKKGPFSEHSPLLNDLSGSVPNWVKMYNGMLKMYDAECLSKKPVVQHFLFGPTCFVWEGPIRQPPIDSEKESAADSARKTALLPQVPTAAPWAQKPVSGRQPPPLPPPTIGAVATGQKRLPQTGQGPQMGMAPTGAPWASASSRAGGPTAAPWAQRPGGIQTPTPAPWVGKGTISNATPSSKDSSNDTSTTNASRPKD